MRGKTLLSAGVVAVVAVSVGAYFNFGRSKKELKVLTGQVDRGDLAETVGATGALQAVTTVQVGAQVSGTIQALYADFNATVRRGQLVARLDPSLFETQVAQAKANLARAEADVERTRAAVNDARKKLDQAQALSARQLLPASDLVTAQTAHESAAAQLKSSEAAVMQMRAALNQAQVNFEHTIITSPIDGIVINRNVDVGQTVASSFQAPVLFIIAADLTKMQVNANIDEADIGKIHQGQTVKFRVDAYPNQEFIGTVRQVRLQPQTVQNVVTYNTVIDVPNPELKLKPGMTANVTVEIARRDGVQRVPNAALRFRPSRDVFAALGQEPPPELSQAVRRADAGTAAAGGRAAGERTPAGGRRGMGGGVDTNDPARRRALLERLQGMPAEQRERILSRMRDRGSEPGSEPQADKPPADPGSGVAPDRPTVTPGRVWRFMDGQLKPVTVRLGISDGTYTELVSGDLRDGADLVIGVQSDQPSAPPVVGGSPLAPQPFRRR